ncbi:DUF2976 domain-containing protein [Vibrio mediterranei]|uniref:DUF2976 domain-containing protein n=1 Tax=Vibrio mediterranei TaxID=689 RepID=UPI0038CF2046
MKPRFMMIFWTMLSSSVWAAVPKNTEPTQGSSNNPLEIIFYYAYDIALYGGSIFLGFCFLYFLGHMWDLYSKTREKQATKKDLLSDAIIGVVLFLLSIWGFNYILDLLQGVS